MSNLFQDLRFAVRQLSRSPGFAITAVITLALGIAANVIIFGVLQAVILQPLDVPHAERVLTFARHDGGYPVTSFPVIRDVRDSNSMLSGVAAEQTQIFGLEDNGNARPVWGNEVSGQYFRVMEIHPALGRLLEPADDEPS